jgi:hypothetical protein
MTRVQDGSQAIETRIGTLEFTHDFGNGFPSNATVEKLYDERDFRRACQAYLWSLTAVSVTGRRIVVLGPVVAASLSWGVGRCGPMCDGVAGRRAGAACPVV